MTTSDSPTALAGIEVPSQDLDNRCLAGWLTAHPYRSSLNALGEMDALMQEEDALLTHVWEIIRPYNEHTGDIACAPPAVQALYAVASEYSTPVWKTGNVKHSGCQEKYPLGKWERQMATYRGQMRLLRRALSDYEAAVQAKEAAHDH